MSVNTPKPGTPRRALPATPSGRRVLATPKQPITPDCYNNVLMETPKTPASHRTSSSTCDEECNLRVAVRIRPLTATESSNSADIVHVKDKQIIVCAPKLPNQSAGVEHTFNYDHVFWSVDPIDSLYSKQEDVFITLGVPLLNSAFKGFNACLFAYGQTGSGKSYSMMGKHGFTDSDEQTGIIPRFCMELFKRKAGMDNINIELSYYEIYNEKIHDLLTEVENGKTALRVREHPHFGPYIVGLTTHTVSSYKEIRNFIVAGNKRRSVMATALNEASSRSHSIFSIEIGQGKTDSNSKRSRISLVDLAGSERAEKNSDAKMGVHINKSLLTLGKCISALADKKNQFIPYRDSVLTWLLKESLGGNSLTSMLATITPSSNHLEETLSTLRYACQARSIVNRARINESVHDKTIRELRLEVERLKLLREDYEKHQSKSNHIKYNEMDDIKSKLLNTEQLLKQTQDNWEKRFMECQEHQLKELADAEKYRVELESKVRVLNTVNDNLRLSPYRTDFLKQLEGVLNEQPKNLEDFKLFCKSKGLICTTNNEIMKIVNPIDKTHAIVGLNDFNLENYENFQDFLTELQWCQNITEKSLTKPEVTARMTEIYSLLSSLQPEDMDSHLSLLYARLNKMLLKFETTLLNSLNQPKAVTFNLDD